MSIITLILLNRLEKKMFPAMRDKLLELRYKNGVNPDLKAAQEILSNFGITNRSMDVKQNSGKNKSTRIRYFAGIPESTDLSKLARVFKATCDVERVEIKEKY